MKKTTSIAVLLLFNLVLYSQIDLKESLLGPNLELLEITRINKGARLDKAYIETLDEEKIVVNKKINEDFFYSIKFGENQLVKMSKDILCEVIVAGSPFKGSLSFKFYLIRNNQLQYLDEKQHYIFKNNSSSNQGDLEKIEFIDEETILIAYTDSSRYPKLRYRFAIVKVKNGKVTITKPQMTLPKPK